MMKHIMCCIKPITLCKEPQEESDDANFCEDCLRLEVQDEYCPYSDKGCEAVRLGEVE